MFNPEGVQISYAIFGPVGLPELLVILVIALFLFGGKKLPEVARSMGQALRVFKDEASKLRSDVELEIQKEEASKGSIEAKSSASTPPGTEKDKPKAEQKA